MTSSVPYSSGPLDHVCISQALLASVDDGQTLDFSHKSICEINDEAIQELASIGRGDDDDEGCVTRIALLNNQLSSLPNTMGLISRLRYLNLRSNSFTVFPEVLTTIPSLEILDIGRNKITQLPLRAGTLRNLTVFSLAKNSLERLPGYLSEFTRLKMLKVEHNPIQWPPEDVLRLDFAPDDTTGMELWVSDLRDWLRNNPEDDPPPYLPRSGDPLPYESSALDNLREIEGDYPQFSRSRHRQASISDGFLHSRVQSTDSIDIPPPLHLRSLQNGAYVPSPPAKPVASATSSPSLSPALPSANPEASTPQDANGFNSGLSQDDSALNGSLNHGRNASYSITGRTVEHGTILSKKSLPDLRKVHASRQIERKIPSSRRPGEPSRRVTEGPALPSSNGLHPSPPERHTSRPNTGNSSSNPSRPAPPMDVERNSYFRRLSTLPSSTISKTIPDALLSTADSIRGILFAVSQMYAAIRHYTVFGIDDRLSGVLGRVLDPASTYMQKLINSLDRFDSISRRGIPPPTVCRALLENCRDNVAMFGKVVGVLQAQLKVLAGTDDLRYSRTLLLMLYGAIGEVSNSWNSMTPHFEAIRPFLNDYRPPPISKSYAVSGPNTPHTRSNITPILESPLASPRALRSPNEHSTPNKSRAARRQAGSFSHKDIQMGRSLASTQSSPSDNQFQTTPPAEISPTNGFAGGLRSAMKNPFPAISRTDSSSPPAIDHVLSASPYPFTHSRDSSLNSSYNPSPGPSRAPPPSSRTNGGAASPLPLMARSRTSDLPGSSQLVDRDLLATMEAAADAAAHVWSQIDEILVEGDESQAQLNAAIVKLQAVTGRLRADIQAVRDGYLQSDKKALWEDAHYFAKIVVQIVSIIKRISGAQELSPELRGNVGKLAQNTKEFTILLHVSSFSPSTPRPFSPAFSSLGLAVDEVRGSGALGRSRSATATQQITPKVSKGQLKEVPWSAMPHQSFKVPSFSSSERLRSDLEDDRDTAHRRL